MLANQSDVLQSLVAVQAEFRKLPMGPAGGRPTMESAAKGGVMSLLRTALRPGVGPTIVFGCRLMHWNPELENCQFEMIYEGQPRSYKFYAPHLDKRSGSKPYVFFEKLYKTKYAAPGDAGPPLERQLGITYSGLYAKSQTKPHLDALKQCATTAGALVASAREQLASILPAATLAAKQDLHRWIFTVYDIAWRKPPDGPLAATRYIPFQPLNESMGTDESIVYDLDHLRATPWADVEHRWDKNHRAGMSYLQGPYESWRVELPQYYASRIDDFVRASDWAVDWLVKQLGEH